MPLSDAQIGGVLLSLLVAGLFAVLVITMLHIKPKHSWLLGALMAIVTAFVITLIARSLNQ